MPKNKMDELCDILDAIIKASPEHGEAKPGTAEATEFYNRLKGIYNIPGFEHSDTHLYNFLSEQTPDTYPRLNLWLSEVIKYGKTLGGPERPTCRKIEKLSDHIEWETIRMTQTRTLKQLQSDTYKLIERSRDEVRNLNAETKRIANDVNKRIDDFHSQSIAILGIFSAVVLVFMTGINFSSSVLDNINKASLFRLGFTILLLGLVLSNVIYILLRYILYLSKRSSTKEPRKYKVGQVWLNIVLVTLLALLFLAYAFGLDQKIARYRQDYLDMDAASSCAVSAASIQNEKE